MKETIVVGHIALIQRSKRQDFVLNVLAGLKKEGFDVIGLFAGKVREDDFLSELQKQAEKDRMESCVRFLGRRSDIPDLLKVLDVLMIPSSFEGFPLAGLEAAAAGVPVVACDAAGAKEFIEASGDGLTFREGNVDEAVACIEKVVLMKKKMIESGQVFAREASMESYAERLEMLFQAAI